MLVGAALALASTAGLAAAPLMRRLPPRGAAALALAALPPLGLYYLLGSC